MTIYKKMDLFSLFSIYVILYFYIHDALLFIFPDYAPHVKAYLGNEILVLSNVFIFYIFCYIAFRFFNQAYQRFPQSKSTVSHSKVIRNFGIIFVLSVLAYSSAHGGLLGALRDAQLQRSGYGSYSALDFFKRFFYLGIPISCYYAYLFKNSKTTNNLLFLVVSFGLTFLSFTLLAGRTNIIILLFLIAFIFADGKSMINIILILIPMYFIIQFADDFFGSLQNINSLSEAVTANTTKENNKNIFNFFEEFAYAINSLSCVLDNLEQVQLSYFKDPVFSFIDLLPSFIYTSPPYYTSAYTNTFFLTGIMDSNIPPGIIAYSYYAFGMAGIVIGPLLFGLMGNFIIRISRALNEKGLGFYKSYIWFAWFAFAQSGEPRVFLNAFIINCIFFYFILKSKEQQPEAYIYDQHTPSYA